MEEYSSIFYNSVGVSRKASLIFDVSMEAFFMAKFISFFNCANNIIRF